MRGRGLVLVAEDNDEFRECVCDGLRNNGFVVDSYLNGAAALAAALSATPPFVVLTDLDMPISSGYDLIAGLRARSLLGPIPVVVLTASETTPIHGVPVIKKPARLDEITAVLDEHMLLANARESQARALLAQPSACVDYPTFSRAQGRALSLRPDPN